MANDAQEDLVYLCSACNVLKPRSAFSLTQQKRIKPGVGGAMQCKTCVRTKTLRTADPPRPIRHSYGPNKPEKPGCPFCGHRLKWCCWCCSELRTYRGMTKQAKPTQSTCVTCDCSSCKLILPKTAYSHSGWGKRTKGRARCTSCVRKALDNTNQRAKSPDQRAKSPDRKLRRVSEKKSSKRRSALWIDEEDAQYNDFVALDVNGCNSDFSSDDSAIPQITAGRRTELIDLADIGAIGFRKQLNLPVATVESEGSSERTFRCDIEEETWSLIPVQGDEPAI